MRRHRDYHGLQNYYVLQELSSHENDLEVRVFNKLLLHQVFEVVKTFTPSQQEQFYLYYFLGYTKKEIAISQGKHNTTINRSLKAIVDKLRTMLK